MEMRIPVIARVRKSEFKVPCWRNPMPSLMMMQSRFMPTIFSAQGLARKIPMVASTPIRADKVPEITTRRKMA
jgi:hypothetical protein